MLLRLFLIAIIIGMALRFIGRLFRALLMRPIHTASSKKDSTLNIDDSQIQDADFKDL